MRPTEELVESAKAGDRAAITQLVDHYQHTAIMAAWAIVGDFHLAEDVAQESFGEVLRQLQQLRNSSSFGPWLLKSVRRKANRVRARRRNEIHGLELSEMVCNRRQWLQEFEDLLPMIADLREQEMDVISLRYIGGLSVKEISLELDRPVGTVTKQLSRAIKRLKNLLVEVDS